MTLAAPGETPFFVVGSDRSGTTLLRLMLNEHPRLHIPPESWFVSHLLDTLPLGQPLSEVQVGLACDIVTRHWRWKDWGIGAEAVRAAVADRCPVDLAQLVDRVFGMAAERRGKPRWGDKTPGYAEEIDRLHALFPAAKFVHIVRDGRDVCVSLRSLGWRGRTTVDVARYWSGAVATARAAGGRLDPQLYCDVTYEDLVLRTEETLRRVCAFLGEAFQDRMLHFYEGAPREIAAWETAIHAKVGRAPQPSDVQRWRREMSLRDVALFEAIAGPTLDAAGYPPHFRRSAHLLRSLASTVLGAASVARQVGLMPAWRGLCGWRPAPEREPPAAAGPPVWRWEVGDRTAELDRHAAAWNALAHARAGSLFADAIWMRAFCRAFMPRQRTHLHLLSRNGALAAVLALRRRRGLLARWSVLADYHTQGPPMALDETLPEVYGRVLQHLLRSASVLDFGRLPVHGTLCRGLMAAARRQKLPCAVTATRGEAVIDTAKPWSRLRASLPAGLRKDAERNELRLAGLGLLALAVIETPAALPRVLEECLHLETLGWKGRRGSPIKWDPATLQFYTELALAAAAAGRMALYTLRLDDRLIAFEYCLRDQREIALLKISFDPELGKYSPGHVLRLKILQRECERGDIVRYSMGPESHWKLRWASRIEPIARLRVYRAGIPGALGYAVGPGFRRLLAHVPSARRAALGIDALLEARRRRRRLRKTAWAGE